MKSEPPTQTRAPDSQFRTIWDSLNFFRNTKLLNVWRWGRGFPSVSFPRSCSLGNAIEHWLKAIINIKLLNVWGWGRAFLFHRWASPLDKTRKQVHRTCSFFCILFLFSFVFLFNMYLFFFLLFCFPGGPARRPRPSTDPTRCRSLASCICLICICVYIYIYIYTYSSCIVLASCICSLLFLTTY